MSHRSYSKGPYVDEKLLKKVATLNAVSQKKIIKTWARDCQIPPEFVGHTFGVHCGNKHIPVYVSENMVGHRLGEFAPTRKFKGHGGRLARDIGAGSVEGGTPVAGGAPGAPGVAPAATATPKPAAK